MNKIFTTLLLGLLLFSFASASEIDTVKQGDGYNVIVLCEAIGACTSAVECNATVLDEDKTAILSDEAMQYNGQYFNLSINSSQLENLGTYNAIGFCSDGTDSDTFDFNFEVTPSGKSGTNNIMFYVIILLLGYVLNLLGFFKQNAIITILGGMVLIFTGLYMVQNGIVIYRDSLTLAISYITLFWGVGSSLWAAIEVID